MTWKGLSTQQKQIEKFRDVQKIFEIFLIGRYNQMGKLIIKKSKDAAAPVKVIGHLYFYIYMWMLLRQSSSSAF